MALAGAAAFTQAAIGFPGELDWSFGKVTTPIPLGVPWSQARVELAATPDGGSVVAEGHTIVRYRADGNLETGFGSDGVRRIVLPQAVDFEVGDLAVDSEGKVVVIGTATRLGSTRQPPPSFAAVVRYLPDGTLDLDFGGGRGYVMGRFGLGSGRGAPTVTASLGAVSPRGWIALIVGTIGRTPTCGGPPQLREHDRLVVWLNPDGSRTRLGDRGVERIDPLERVAGMAFSVGGETVLAGALPRPCGRGPESGVISLREDGTRRPAFALAGLRRLTGRVAAIAVDRHGRTVVLFKEKQRPARDEHAYKVLRLLADGEQDPAFSGGWVVYTAQGPSYRWTDLVIDSHDRPLLIGTLVRELPTDRGRHRFHRWFMVVPLRRSGLLRNKLGWRGWIAITRFDEHSDAAAGEALLEGDRWLLIAGTVRRPTLAPRGGIGLVRLGL
jgi:hypothetical protein